MPQISSTKPDFISNNKKIVLLNGKILFKRGRKTPAKDLSSEQIYERKKQQRLERARRISEVEELNNYIEWIRTIQTKLNLTNTEFAAKLGVSCQSVKLWKRKSGHFPSRRSLLRLLELELEARIPVKVIRIRYGVRM